MSRIPVEDRLDTQELVARYAFLCDSGQHSNIHDLFTDDGLFAESIIGMPIAHGAAELKHVFVTEGAKASHLIHINCNHLINTFDGSNASGTTHLHVEAPLATGTMLRISGYYDDVYAKVDGRWRIRRRQLKSFLPIQGLVA